MIHSVTLGASHVTAALAMSFGGNPQDHDAVVGGSIVVWASAFAILSSVGAEYIHQNVDSDGILHTMIDQLRTET